MIIKILDILLSYHEMVELNLLYKDHTATTQFDSRPDQCLFYKNLPENVPSDIKIKVF